MARLDSYKAKDIKGLIKEWCRDDDFLKAHGYMDEYGNLIPLQEKANGDLIFPDPKHRIDPDLIDDNYCMEPKAKTVETFTELLDERLSKMPKVKNSNQNIISVWVVTCPLELEDDEEKRKEFFEMTYKFMQKRYGADAVLNGFVHNEETSSHMHIPIIPVTNKWKKKPMRWTKTGKFRETKREAPFRQK